MSLNDKPQGDLWDDYHSNPEYELFDSVINEFTDIGGTPVHYGIKTNVENADSLYGEDQNETFNGPYQSRVVYDLNGEEEEVLNSMGISSDDTLQSLYIPISKFREDISQKYGDSEYDPKPGDTIKLLGNNKLYSITSIGGEQTIFMGKRMCWSIICRPLTFSEESSSAEDMLESEPVEEFFDEQNTLTETQKLSAYGENDNIEEESYANPDSAVYGYD